LTLSLTFESEQIMEGCDLLDKFRSAATGVSMLRKIPGLSILGSVGLPFQFASFVTGCEAFKPPGWPKENEP
jgi:hypothetical protein